MISTKLKKIILFTLLLIYAHGIEEMLMGFWKVDSVVMTWNKYLTSIPQAVYYASHIPFWFFVTSIFFLILGGKWTLRVLALFGVIFVFELHHVFGAIFISHGYYPGLITAIFYPVVGFFYWKELLNNFNENRQRKT